MNEIITFCHFVAEKKKGFLEYEAAFISGLAFYSHMYSHTQFKKNPLFEQLLLYMSLEEPRKFTLPT